VAGEETHQAHFVDMAGIEVEQSLIDLNLLMNALLSACIMSISLV
jgi:hypothetical protein